MDDTLRGRLLELVYDLLPQDEADALRRQIESDPAVAATFEEAKRTAALLGDAARHHAPRVALGEPDRSSEPTAAPAGAPAAVSVVTTPTAVPPVAAAPRRGNGRIPIVPRNPWARGANWIVASCAAALLVTSLGVYLYHHRQLGAIAEEHLRVIVAAPSLLSPGAPSQVHVRTMSVTGEPTPAQLELALYAPDGRKLWGHKERTGPQGRLDAVLPGAEEVPAGARLEVLAVRHDKFERLELPVGVEPVARAVHLQTDKPFYRPGETVRYRAVTLDPFDLLADPEATIRFEVRKPDGAVVAGSILAGVTDRGVGNGECALPAGAAEGTYSLAVRSADDVFPPRELRFAVRRPAPAEGRPATSEPTQATPQDGEPSEGRNDSGDVAPEEALDVRFYPEGGRLAPELENRVYFSARTGRGEPANVKGFIVDASGNEVAVAETAHDGSGVFRIVPEAGARYRLRVALPGGDFHAALPQATRETQVALTTGTGVFDAGEPLEFNVRSSMAGLPLVVGAWRRGALVGQQALVTSDKHQGNHPVAIPLDDKADGVIRLTVFDYGGDVPRPLAERLVYRRSSRRLSVDSTLAAEHYEPGDVAEVALRVRDSANRPAPAVLGVVVVEEPLLDESAFGPSGTARASLATDLLLAGALPSPGDLKDADFYLSDDPKAALALDLLLGTRGWLQPPEDPAPDGPHWLADAGLPAPPAIADNLGEIHQRYEESLTTYRASQTRTLSTVTTLTFFGGLGLLLLVAMLGLLNIVSGTSFWLPAAGATACCLAIGAILLDPERQPVDAVASVAFSRFDGVLLAERRAAAEANRPELPPSVGQRKGENANAAEEKSERAVAAARQQASRNAASGAGGAAPAAAGAAPGAAVPRAGDGALRRAVAAPTVFPIREYAFESGEHAADRTAAFSGILYWHPLLPTDADGRATLVLHLPDRPAAFRILVDAHGGGRIGGGTWRLVSRLAEPAPSEPPPSEPAPSGTSADSAAAP